MSQHPGDDVVASALEQLRAGSVVDALSILQSGGPAHHAGQHAALGMVRLAQGDWISAHSAFRLAVSLGDCRPETALNLALAEDRAGDPRHGQALMIELRDRLPDWDEPALRLAESRRREDDPTGAEAAYQDALDRNPQRADALLGLPALLMDRRGRRLDAGAAHDDPTRAQMLLLQCCAVAPGRADAWHALG